MTTPSSRPRSALSGVQIISRLGALEGWKLCGDGDKVSIEKTITFNSYLETIAFVNAVAFLAERLDHHPELLVGYQRCSVRFNTHDVGGISALDFDAARRVDDLLQASEPCA